MDIMEYGHIIDEIGNDVDKLHKCIISIPFYTEPKKIGIVEVINYLININHSVFFSKRFTYSDMLTQFCLNKILKLTENRELSDNILFNFVIPLLANNGTITFSAISAPCKNTDPYGLPKACSCCKKTKCNIKPNLNYIKYNKETIQKILYHLVDNIYKYTDFEIKIILTNIGFDGLRSPKEIITLSTFDNKIILDFEKRNNIKIIDKMSFILGYIAAKKDSDWFI